MSLKPGVVELQKEHIVMELESIDRMYLRAYVPQLTTEAGFVRGYLGHRFASTILQAEFSLTQIWDRALSGRYFLEKVIRENIDLGRPEQVQLIFSCKLKRSTVADGRCCTRIITEGVIPSLHIY